MALLAVNQISKAGLADLDAILAAADVAGDSYKSANNTFIVMKNTDGSSHALTVAAPFASADCENLGELDVDPIVLTVAPGDTGFVSIPGGYSVSAEFAWTYDAITGVTIGVFSIKP